MPLNCLGDLRVPTELTDSPAPALAAWSIATHGDLKIVKARCLEKYCPTGPAAITFSTPVRGAEVVSRLRILPATKFTVRDTARESTTWVLDASLKPRVAYAIVADTALRDIFGQPLTGNPAIGMQTTGYEPSVDYTYGRLVVERTGFGTITIQSVNVDTLVATILPIPDSLEAKWMSLDGWGYRRLWRDTKGSDAIIAAFAVTAPRDRNLITRLDLPLLDARLPRTPTLFAVKIQPPSRTADSTPTHRSPSSR